MTLTGIQHPGTLTAHIPQWHSPAAHNTQGHSQHALPTGSHSSAHTHSPLAVPVPVADSERRGRAAATGALRGQK